MNERSVPLNSDTGERRMDDEAACIQFLPGVFTAPGAEAVQAGVVKRHAVITCLARTIIDLRTIFAGAASSGYARRTQIPKKSLAQEHGLWH